MNMHNLLLFKLGFPELVLIAFFGVIPLGLIIFCLSDILKAKFGNSTTKNIWLLIILFLPVLGALLYLLVGRTKKIA